MAIRRVRSKWSKTAALLADPRLRELVPETRRFSRDALEDMLERYGMVYAKPVNGTFGKGVVRIERLAGTGAAWQIHYGDRKVRFPSFAAMFRRLSAVKLRRPYLVQRGIRLLAKNGRPFDLRVMVQKNPHDRWESTGIIARLARRGRAVTNYHSGGTPMPAERLLIRHVDAPRLRKLIDRLQELGLQTAEALDRRFPGIKEVGLDIGLDKSLTPWIIETNTAPDPFIFRKLPDRSVFRRIYRYAKAYGRFRKAGGRGRGRRGRSLRVRSLRMRSLRRRSPKARSSRSRRNRASVRARRAAR
ncbi:MAG TPA: YheC/YheD family protein [Paenibacillaceae bacterium]